MGKNSEKNFNFEEKQLADKVADEILTVEDEEERRYFFLILLFLLCLIFLVSSLSFAIFDTYYNGTRDNSVDVNINVDSDDDDIGKRPGPSIDSGKIYFSYNAGSNYINIKNAYPTYDKVGKTLSGDKQYFDFTIDARFTGNSRGTLVYEISAVPVKGNTIDDENIRVYLTEDDKEVSVLDESVNNFSDLPNSKFQKNGKVLYRKVVNGSYSADYVFRMWLSSEAFAPETSEKFGCKIAVDAYYR